MPFQMQLAVVPRIYYDTCRRLHIDQNEQEIHICLNI